jgi:hypothetical protein
MPAAGEGAGEDRQRALEEAMDALEADHRVLLKGDVFTED